MIFIQLFCDITHTQFFSGELSKRHLKNPLQIALQYICIPAVRMNPRKTIELLFDFPIGILLEISLDRFEFLAEKRDLLFSLRIGTQVFLYLFELLFEEILFVGLFDLGVDFVAYLTLHFGRLHLFDDDIHQCQKTLFDIAFDIEFVCLRFSQSQHRGDQVGDAMRFVILFDRPEEICRKCAIDRGELLDLVTQDIHQGIYFELIVPLVLNDIDNSSGKCTLLRRSDDTACQSLKEDFDTAVRYMHFAHDRTDYPIGVDRFKLTLPFVPLSCGSDKKQRIALHRIGCRIDILLRTQKDRADHKRIEKEVVLYKYRQYGWKCIIITQLHLSQTPCSKYLS